MIMTHIFTFLLFVLMCRSSNAAFTGTLPTGLHSYAQNAIINNHNNVLNSDPNYSGGIYTVPAGQAGTYLVSVTMMSGDDSTHTTLMKNGAIYVWLYTGEKYEMATQTVSMTLVVGDQIRVQMTNKASTLFDVYNTFTVAKIESP
ncbi:uncharacterized protein LOC134682000 [Mytilus trossulus]|uniref:uncharacterized protein LOC134682000 n=1 Tax=Mytilus trossulus TaxID=6551 RepID=UPI00300481D8